MNGSISTIGNTTNAFSTLARAIGGSRTGDTLLTWTQNHSATIQQAFDLCLTGPDLTLRGDASEQVSSYGRYYNNTNIWRDEVKYYEFASYSSNFTVLAHLWPGIFGVGPNWQYKDGYNPTWIVSVTPTGPKFQRYFYAAYCAANSTGGKVTTVSVPAGGGWMGGNWGAVEGSNPNFYSYQCASSNSQAVRVDDLLACDKYGTTGVMPYTYTAYSYKIGVSEGWELVGGDGSGGWDNGSNWRSCTGYGDGTMGCSWGHYEWATGYVKNPTPAGYIDTGTNWSTTSYNSIVIEQKYAAPIAAAAPARFLSTGVYDANADGSPIWVSWRKPRINVPGSGQDVTTVSGGDVKWRVRFTLTPSSSPVLIRDAATGASVNDPNYYGQPYHLFLDNSPSTSNDAPATSQKWLPMSWGGAPASVPLNTMSQTQAAGFDDQSRALFLRFFESSKVGKVGWTVTPWWEVTVTVPVTSTK
ncbi:MAG: hypothetical protein Q8N51_11590, partial [Gammaproteobacteria bacterium]|nr:hypothetical protein [Gammaproteobacteria bacterium]